MVKTPDIFAIDLDRSTEGLFDRRDRLAVNVRKTGLNVYGIDDTEVEIPVDGHSQWDHIECEEITRKAAQDFILQFLSIFCDIRGLLGLLIKLDDSAFLSIRNGQGNELAGHRETRRNVQRKGVVECLEQVTLCQACFLDGLSRYRTVRLWLLTIDDSLGKHEWARWTWHWRKDMFAQYNDGGSIKTFSLGRLRRGPASRPPEAQSSRTSPISWWRGSLFGLHRVNVDLVSGLSAQCQLSK